MGKLTPKPAVRAEVLEGLIKRAGLDERAASKLRTANMEPPATPGSGAEVRTDHPASGF